MVPKAARSRPRARHGRPPSRADLERHVASTDPAKRALDLALANQILEQDADTPEAVMHLIIGALRTSPLCNRAYVQLGRSLEDLGSGALPFFRAAVDAVELGGKAGDRASYDLVEATVFYANALRGEGDPERAVATLEAILPRTGDQDAVAICYLLAPWLVELNRDADAVALLAQHPEDESAEWSMHRALLAFRREGDVPASRDLLRKAAAIDPSFAQQLAERVVLWRLFNDSAADWDGDRLIGLVGDTMRRMAEGEAADDNPRVMIWVVAWATTRGAVEWLVDTLGLVPAAEPLTGEPC